MGSTTLAELVSEHKFKSFSRNHSQFKPFSRNHSEFKRNQEILKKSGIDIGYMFGQGHNGSAAMAGIKNGIQKHICDKRPEAVYRHYAACSLILCVLKAGQVYEISKAVTLTNKIAVIFSESNKTPNILLCSIDGKCGASKRLCLKEHS